MGPASESEQGSEALDAESTREDTSSLSPTKALGKSDESNNAGETTTQKRRRVTRACDECRRKKIKCDGRQPCTHCTVYSYDCTYDQPSHRRRNPTPQYIAALERRLARSEALLHTFVPNLDVNDPGLDAVLEHGKVDVTNNTGYGDKNHAHNAIRNATQRSNQTNQQTQPNESNELSEQTLESMLRAGGQIGVDDEGYWDYHGHSSGRSFLQGVRDQLGQVSEAGQANNGGEHRGTRREVSQIPLPEPPGFFTVESPYATTEIGTHELPSRELALQLCSAALDDAGAILKIVHQPSFYSQLDRIYDMDEENFTNADHKFLPLLYVVLGLGCFFTNDEGSELSKGYKSATGVGYKYFWAARQMIDIADCRDLTSLQAIAFMIMFLQCSAKLSTCYSFIGVALHAAMRMGFHRSFAKSFTTIETEVRKRVFWALRKMDIYVGALLGLPQTINDNDIDQELPAETDDEYITNEGLQPMPEGRVAQLAAANANFRLSSILSKIVRNIYPIKGFRDGGNPEARSPGIYSVSFATIRELEADLHRWMEELPPELKPDDRGSRDLIRMQQLLRLAYAHAQLMLYRPFLHYVSPRNQNGTINPKSYACAAACVGVSRNIIHITADMKRRGLLEGSYWFTMYTTFFGILAMVYFALENSDNSTRREILEEAKEGKETLARLARRSMAADRCTSTLNALFEQIGDELEDVESPPATTTGKRELSVTGAEPSAEPSAEFNYPDSPHREMGELNISARSKDRRANPSSQQKQRNAGLMSQPQQQNHTLRPPQQQHPQPQQHQRASGPVDDNFMPLMTDESHIGGSEAGTFSTPTAHQTQSNFDNQNQHLQYLPPNFPQDMQQHGSLSDLSAMMFSSENPFQYPPQPVTSLEELQNQGFQLHADSGSMSGGEDHIDVQLFGPLPPYMAQQQSPHQNLGAFEQGQMQDVSMSQASPSTAAEMWGEARSHGLPGMNLDDIFSGHNWTGST